MVVTGLGLVTPLGTGLDKTWTALCSGKSGVRRITRFDPSTYACQIAGEVTDFDPAQYIEKKEIKKMDTFIHFAVGASQMAVDDAGLKVVAEKALPEDIEFELPSGSVSTSEPASEASPPLSTTIRF